jgi:hypothetical protein
MNSGSFFLLSFAFALPARAEINLEFCGYMVVHSEYFFVLANRETGTTSRWLRVGELFDGCRVVEFDSKRELVFLDHAGRTSVVFLKDAPLCRLTK